MRKTGEMKRKKKGREKRKYDRKDGEKKFQIVHHWKRVLI